MGDSFTIQISGNLVNQLSDDGEKLKKKTRKLKTKVPRDPQLSQTKVHQKQISDDSETRKGTVAAGWPLQHPLFLPVSPPPQPAIEELDAIRSVLQESEKVVERLQKQEEDMVREVTQRSKDLHDKEFKLPYRKPMPCLAEKDACFECYKEHVKDPLKCAHLVKIFEDCARRVRQEVSSANK
uniref:Coiled-coil-helix-coiled-coil-helix domain-containing protein 3 n=1 Tax=Davidia involucrata TaxID=16924 RepID=A0A5B6YUA5_DAVIN